MRVYRKYVLRVLDGDFWSIDHAFHWKETPQGYNFWEHRCDNGLDLEGAKALLEIVKTAKKEGTLV